jgi:ABC-type bacteriocin/lantibiotic exporter with double-glycine peptidase domain
MRGNVDYEIDAPARSNLIEGVPFFAQTAYDCGPASMAGVLNYYGRSVTPEQIEEAIGREDLRGTVTLDLILYPRNRGFTSEWIEDMPVSELTASIDRGEPLILMVDYGIANVNRNHFLVAVGYTPEAIIVNSGKTEQKKTPWSEFLYRWDRADRWALRILPKE